ncbi:hypothetical protein SAMN05216188_1482 [Lentzea xinjiangensis]|uniref:Uncharacterized protein n=1 Tax=Lentzea xinjiangensis TaxID=402600 RepID=A0A1H9WVX1_9PSEU|nr:hypothetical protein [Lentzea xinjiangensis]SES38090.1 hypothetical protein SAMN05216188_1482 [Lentzea xinjiangensis]
MTPKLAYRLTLLAALTVAVSDIAPAWRGYAWLYLTATALLYLVACWAFPYRNCRACKGLGRSGRRFGGFRLCQRCDATGRQLRAGRKALNAFGRHRNRTR